MTDLERFRRARVNEDIATIDWTVDTFALQATAESSTIADMFVARFSAARMRAEARAKLTLFDLHLPSALGGSSCTCRAEGPGPCPAAAALAWGYFDHPEYDLTWERP